LWLEVRRSCPAVASRLRGNDDYAGSKGGALAQFIHRGNVLMRIPYDLLRFAHSATSENKELIS
jgi:hypothetical protein